MSDKGRISFERILPVAGLLLTALALFGKGYPSWVRYSTVGVGALLTLAWFFSEARWISLAIRRKFFPDKLSKDHVVRLGVLLDEINNYMSTSYVLSPFSVWHNSSNDYPNFLRMNYRYHSAIHTWLLDLKGMCDSLNTRGLFVVLPLSRAISSAAILGKQAEEELQRLVGSEEVSEEKRRQIIKSWGSARERYNVWLDKWQDLMKEIDKVSGIGCILYFQPLDMLGGK
jgi:hypothetical protein